LISGNRLDQRHAHRQRSARSEIAGERFRRPDDGDIADM
jgi:hypothetical protein